jgi:hypothetical protein
VETPGSQAAATRQHAMQMREYLSIVLKVGHGRRADVDESSF